MKNARPLHDRLIVFTLQDRQKTDNGLLYRGNSHRGDVERRYMAWVLNYGPKCKLHYEKGSRVLIPDGFEMSQLFGAELDLWPSFSADPAFASLRLLAKKLEAKIKTSIVSEKSLLAVFEPSAILEGDEIKTSSGQGSL